jgi:methyl-CpG-binding domain protein 4
MDELRSRCATMAATGSPHHLCLHLCYYREYDAARQLFVLRTRLAAAVGSASALDGWRAELRCATREEWGGGTPKKKTRPRRRRTKKPTKRRKKNGRDDDDDDDGDDVGDGDDEENETEDEAPEDDREDDPRGAKSPGRTTGGWLSAKSLPWRVVYVSPSGETFDSASDALTFLGVDANKAPPAAHNAAGGGGLGNETLDDFEWRDDDGGGGGGGAARRDARIGGARARGQVAPPPRVVDNNVSWPRASHGGSGVRLARPETRGLDDATDLLRAALWPEARDEDVGTEPVRARLRAAREGAPRSPVRLAPDPFSTGGDDGTSIDAPRSLAVAVVGPTDARDGAHDPTSGDASPSAAGTGKRWWAPPRSPFGLLEEILFEDEWKLLTACMLLNCTTRLQVDRALWRLFLLAPTPEEAVRLGRDGGEGGGGGGDDQYDAGGDGAAVAVDAQLCARRPKRRTGLDAIEDVLAPLGLHRKRARAFVRLSEDYLAATRPRGEALEANGGGGGGDGGLFSTRTKLAAPAASLHGVGAYASDAHAMFCDGLMGVAPRDHALRWWYAWAVERRESGRRRRSDAGDGEASS